MKTLVVLCRTIHHGAWYLKRGDTLPEGVPSALAETWLKAKLVGTTAPAAPVAPAPAPAPTATKKK